MQPEEIKTSIPQKIFRRGLKYYYQGNIEEYDLKRTAKDEVEISARVSGTWLYTVEIKLMLLDGGIYLSHYYCDCPYDWGDICKHMVAVVNKFYEEDYEQLTSKSFVSDTYRKLLALSEVEDRSKPWLNYSVKGFLNQDLKNFKLLLKSADISDYDLGEIVNRLNTDQHYRFNQNEFKEYFIGRELELINRLNKLDKSKGREDHSLLLSRNRENFEFLLSLMDEYQVIMMENNKRAKKGEKIQPELYLSGNEEQVELKINRADYKIYSDHLKQIYWTVIDNVVHPLNIEPVKDLLGEIEIPAGREGEFIFEILPGLKEKLPLTVSKELTEHEVIKQEPEVEMELDYVDGEIHCRLQVEFAGDSYKNSEILGLDLDHNQYTRDKDNPRLWYCRDNKAFARVVEFFEYYNFRVRPKEFILRSGREIQEFITDGMVHIPEEWKVETSEAFDQIEINPVELEPTIELEAGEGIDWFDFRITYNLGGKTYTRQELEAMISYNNRGEPYVQIGNQYFILQSGEREEEVSKIINQAESSEDDSYRSQYYNLLYYQDLARQAGIEFKGNRVYDELEEDITGKRAVVETDIPVQVRDILRDYQKRGYFWLNFLTKYNFGGVLADDMGLGKTVQVLTLIHSRTPERPALVVCPRTLIYNWQEEAAKFFPDLSCLVYYGTPSERKGIRNEFTDHEIVVTSYSIISRDFNKFKQEGLEFSFCILDEAQHIKNHKTKRARAVKNLKAENRLALTGTPLENSVSELWSIFDFLMPGYLGNFNQFRKNYLNPIKNNNDEKKIQELKQRVAPFILRRKKEEVLQELPEKITSIQPVDMTQLQEDSYRYVLEEVRGEILETVRERGFSRSRINVLAALTKLRQICNHPGLVLGEEALQHKSGKMEVLKEVVEDALDSGHKVIVFSQFVKMLKLIRQNFDQNNISYEYLDGSTRNRMERVNRFNNSDDKRVFLISLKAGGLGLNLTAADIVIHVDPWWNPMVEKQATDRTHRFGQENRVMVYKLITRGTVEEKMLKLQRKKQNIFDTIIENNKNPVESITWKDIQELLEITS